MKPDSMSESDQTSLAEDSVVSTMEAAIEETLEQDELERTQLGDYMKIFGGQAFSLVGSALVQFALVWWLTYSTGSAIVLSLATMMVVLPQIVVSPFAGALVDRWNRRRIMIATDALSAGAVTVLALLWSLGVVEMLHVFVAMAIRSTLGNFQWPALQASASLMVPKEHLSRVNGMYQAISGMARIAAPALGALLLMFVPIHMVILLDIGTAAMAILPLLKIRVPQPASAAKSNSITSGVASEIREGFTYMRNWKSGSFVTLALMMANFVIVPTFSMTPLLVLLHFSGGAFELALFESMMGVGMVLGGVTLGIWGGFKRRMLTSLIGLLVASASIFVIGLAPPTMIGLAVAGVFVAGAMIPMASGSIMAVVQSVVPPKIQGRVFTVLMSLGPVMTPIGLVIAGAVIEGLGFQSWYLLGGIILAIVGIVGGMKKSIMTLGEIKSDP